MQGQEQRREEQPPVGRIHKNALTAAERMKQQ
jgi:hypothetical protein